MQFGFKCTEIWIDYENQTQNNQLGFQLIKSIFVLFSQFYQLIHGNNEKQLLKNHFHLKWINYHTIDVYVSKQSFNQLESARYRDKSK